MGKINQKMGKIIIFGDLSLKNKYIYLNLNI